MLHARHTFELSEPSTRLVVVADTHGRPHPESARHIAAEKPYRILHAGDIGDLSVLDELDKIAPVLAVRGNIDVRARRVPDTITLDVVDAAKLLLRMLIVHIGVNGTRLRREVAELARSENASLVVCGHSHVPFIGMDNGMAVFNPGSIGPRRFHLPIVFGVIDIDRDSEREPKRPRVRLRHVDCETGATWTP
jgi:putative phosphoesterase